MYRRSTTNNNLKIKCCRVFQICHNKHRPGHADILNHQTRDHLLTSAPPPRFHYKLGLLNLVELERNGGKGRGASGQRAAFVYQPQKQHGKSKCHITTTAHLVSQLVSWLGLSPLYHRGPSTERNQYSFLLLSKGQKQQASGGPGNWRSLDLLQVEHLHIH